MTESKDHETVPEPWNAAGPSSDMWMDAAQDPRFAAGTKLEGERATLLDYLRAYRLTMEMKCAWPIPRPAPLAGRVPPSTMSLPCLTPHMADVERNWFRRVMAQADAPPLYWSGDLADADRAGAVADPAVVNDAWQPGATRLRSRRSCRRLPRPRHPRDYARRRHHRAARSACPHDRGVRPPLRPRRPAAGTDRRTRRPVTAENRRDCCWRTAKGRSARNTP